MMGGREDAGEGAAAGETVHVALGRDLKKGRMILGWVFKNLRSREVVIVHVHKPPTLIPMKMGGKFPAHMATPEVAETYITAKRAEMDRILRNYMDLCAGEEISTKKSVIEAQDVYKGIAYLVGQHQIKRLVMGLRSIKGLSVLEEGLLHCRIWLIHNGKLVFTREALPQQISVEFTGGGNQGSFTSSSKSAKENKKSHQDNAALTTGGSWTSESTDESAEFCSEAKELGAGLRFLQSKEIEAGLSKEELETEDIRDLLVKLGETVQAVRQQRLELARQTPEWKREFIEFSLPELEEATNQFLARKTSGREG